ncbi:MAG: hypothetical protein ACKO3P_01055, partial [Planctomycetaceae bacterium]
FPPEAVTREWSGELNAASSPRPTESQSEQLVPEQLPTVAEPTATTESSTEPNSANNAPSQDPADDQATSSAEPAPEPAPGQDAAETEASSVNSATPAGPVDEVPVAAPELPTTELPTAVESGRSLEDLPPAPAVIEEVPVVILCVPPEEGLLEARPEIAPTGEAPTTPVLPTPLSSTEVPAPRESSTETVTPEPAATASPAEGVTAEPTPSATLTEELIDPAPATAPFESGETLPAGQSTTDSVPDQASAESLPSVTVPSVTQPSEAANNAGELESTGVTPLEPQSDAVPSIPSRSSRSRDIPLDHMHCPFGHGMLPARQSPPFEAIDLSLVGTTESAQ